MTTDRAHLDMLYAQADALVGDLCGAGWPPSDACGVFALCIGMTIHMAGGTRDDAATMSASLSHVVMAAHDLMQSRKAEAMFAAMPVSGHA